MPLVATAIFAGGPLLGEYVVRAHLLPRVSERIGRAVTVNDVKVGLGTIELRGLVVDGAGATPPVVIPGLRATVALSSLVSGPGNLHVESVELWRPRIDVVRGESGDDNVSAILDKLRGKNSSAGSGGETKSSRLRVDLVRIHQGNVRLTDDALGQAEVKALDGDLRPDGPATLHVHDARLEAFGARAAADDATVDVTLAHGKPVGLPTIDVKNGSLTPVHGLELTGIRAVVRPDADGERQVIDVHGSYGGASTELWNAVGFITADARQGKLTLRCDRFKLSQLDSVLRNKDGSPEILNATKGEMDAHLDLGFRDDRLAFIGGAHLAGLTIAHPMLAPQPVPRLGFDARIKGVVDTREHTLKLSEATIDFRNLHAVIAADVANLGRKPRFAATLQVHPLPCQVALQAFPVELVPYLQGFKLAGTFSTDLHLGIDLEDLETPVDLGGHVGIEGCKVLQAPEWTSSERLSATFEQTVEYEPGRWMTFVVGPESPDWVPFNEIS
ncbi:MAG TPA: hypothetical protein VHB97_09035, partial [Polyangia bacterium]|nr:hypothetical protein [Polyangia bacterium]